MIISMYKNKIIIQIIFIIFYSITLRDYLTYWDQNKNNNQLTATIMYYKNYLTATVLIFFVGSIFTPSIGMEKDQSQDKLEQAKKLVDYFCIARTEGNNDGPEMNGYEYYIKLFTANHSSMQKDGAHQFALGRLEERYRQQSSDQVLFAESEKRLFLQTLYSDDAPKQLVYQIFNIIAFSEKLGPDIAKEAFRNRLRNFCPTVEEAERLINQIGLQEDGQCNRINEVDLPEDNALMTKLRNFVKNYPLITGIGIATIVSYFLYKLWLK